MSLEDGTEFLHKVTDYWDAPSERTIRWDDPVIGVKWPVEGNPVMSKKDGEASALDVARQT